MHSVPQKPNRRTVALFLRMRPEDLEQIKRHASERNLAPAAYFVALDRQHETRVRESLSKASHRLAVLLDILVKKGDAPAYAVTQLQGLQRTFVDAWMLMKAPYDATHDARGEEQWGG